MDAEGSLYETLGVDRDATQAEVAKAYRRKARASHPDKGGAAEEWHALTLAWEVLGDPGKRARYDETGAVPEGGPPVEMAARAMLVGLFERVLMEKGGVPCHLANEIREGLRGERKKLEGSRRQSMSVLRMFRSQMGRLKGTEADIFEAYLAKKVAAGEEALASVAASLEVVARAEEMVADLDDPTGSAMWLDPLGAHREELRKKMARRMGFDFE